MDKITALDYSFPSLNDLLPLAHYEFKNADPVKVSRVYGSYLNIKESNYDFIFGFGAIHNAPNLELLFRSLYDSLSDGGYFVSSDMCEEFFITNNEEDYLTSRPVPNAKERYGKDLTFADTSDFFRSPYDYLYYAKKAGFRVYPIIFNKDSSKKLSKSFKKAFRHGGINSFFPSGCRGRADRLMLVCHKENIINLLHPSYTPSVICNDTFDKSNIRRLLKKLASKFISN